MFVFVLPFIPGCDKAEISVTPQEINFLADYRAALDAAQHSNKKIVVDFYTDW
jgi:hypothetical protein